MQGRQKTTILVVEDELPHLAFLKNLFEKAGYSVLTAKDGIEAIATYKLRQESIDVVLCDMALPSLGGWTVFMSLREIDPAVKMILTSGYLNEQVKSSFVEGGVKDFIVKPYAAEAVLQSVRRALEN
ncbi:MAG TPA: response regulator [Candidatus Binatia bacterium]|jgi:CheY-like chemotaxis protein